MLIIKGENMTISYNEKMCSENPIITVPIDKRKY